MIVCVNHFSPPNTKRYTAKVLTVSFPIVPISQSSHLGLSNEGWITIPFGTASRSERYSSFGHQVIVKLLHVSLNALSVFTQLQF